MVVGKARGGDNFKRKEHAMYWDFEALFLAAVDKAKEYNLLYELVSWYMMYCREGDNEYTALYHALDEWDLLM